MASPVFILRVPAGIQRDGTPFSARQYIAGQWSRFYRGTPQKMGGYVELTKDSDGVSFSNIPRGTFVIPSTPNFNIYVGDFESLKYFQIDGAGLLLSGLIDRTPVLFPSNADNQWTFDVMFSANGNSSILLAHACPNLLGIDQTTETAIYYGDAQANTPLIPTGQIASGGMVVLHPYLLFFGNSGEVSWTEANDPTTIMDSARVTASKIVAGIQTRGGNSSPAGLLWSLDSVIRVTNVGTNSLEFSFDTVTSQSSMLSSNSVIEYDGKYYWAGVDRFLVYNGTVFELANSMSLQFFFQNLNYAQRQKVWATKYTKYGEIWWWFPAGDSVECNYAVVYNVREESWYDTAISLEGTRGVGGRSSGYYDQTFTRPIWTDNVPDAAGKYPVWRHEIGNDKVSNVNTAGVNVQTTTAIETFIETSAIAWCAIGADGQRHNLEKTVDLERFEPDFIQTGPLSLIVKGKAYANSADVESAPYVFTPTTEKIDMREQRREMTLKFYSNEIGAYYQMGQPLVTMRPGDTRP